MKRTIIFLIIFFVSAKGFGQFAFGISPGLSLNSSYFGFKIGKVVPYVGFQFGSIKYINKESGKRWDTQLDKIVSYDDKSITSGSLYVPSLGVKVFFVEKDKLHAYFNLNVSKPLIDGKMKDNEVEDNTFKEEIKKYHFWGGELGFGTEYFFDEHFSIGGEFGIRMVYFNYKDSYDDIIFDYNTGQSISTTVETQMKVNILPTYSRLSLNYYF